MIISHAGVQVLADREGCKLEAYCDSAGVWTIGVGHTAAAGEPAPVEDMCITQEEADAIFRNDLQAYEATVNETVVAEMAQHEYDAFVSICFNIGQSGFATSTFVQLFNMGDKDGCADAILWWNEPSEIIPRRQGEHVQFRGGYVPRIQEL